jgi:replicative DNA helicase
MKLARKFPLTESVFTEKIILENLIYNFDFAKKIIPFLKKEYFHGKIDRVIFSEISSFYEKYSASPTKDAINIQLNKRKDLNENEFKTTIDYLDAFSVDENINQDWLRDETEEFCKDKAVYNAIMESINIIDGKSSEKTEGSIPTILSDALSVCFDTHIGHDYIEDSESRFEFYNRTEKKIPFDLEFFNDITGGGTPSKTLNVVMAGTGVGKSMWLCHHAAHCLTQNYNVLYITCEMSEERIAERIDANLLDTNICDLKLMSKSNYNKKIENLKETVKGKLIIKEYPTATATANHFRSLLEELKLKKSFIPDIIFIDYLNICASARLKGGNIGSYFLIKSIAEELRGLAVEHDVPIFTATQVNRSGFSNSDMGLEDTSESFGLPQTADFMFALISTEELEELKQILVKQLKNRYNDAAVNKKFILSLDRSKMKFSDVDSSQQTLINSGQMKSEINDKFSKVSSGVDNWKF